MLSGTITIGDEVKDSAYAKGLLLYNHYTVYRADVSTTSPRPTASSSPPPSQARPARWSA